MDRAEVSIVIPTYNERENLPILIEKIDDVMKSNNIKYEVIIVDDSSPDGTAAVAKDLSHKYPVKVIVRKGKRGLSSAVLNGVKISNSNYVVVMDADLQHPPHVIPRMFSRAIKNACDIVVASRYVKGGSVGNWSFTRKLISKAATLIARLMLPRVRKVRDPMSGFFIFKKDVIKGVRLNPKGFKILLEILARGNYRKVCEEPYTFGKRYGGESKLGSKEIIDYLLHILELSPYWVRFGLVGGVGTVVNLSVVALMRYILMFPHVIAAATGIEVSVISNFFMNDAWTFKFERKGNRFVRLLKFHGSSAAGIITQFIVSNALFYYNVIHESVTDQLIGILAGFIINYLLSKWYVWEVR